MTPISINNSHVVIETPLASFVAKIFITCGKADNGWITATTIMALSMAAVSPLLKFSDLKK